MDEPTIVLVAGPPAVGKTNLANYLATKFALPKFSKDDFKEILFNNLGPPEISETHLFGKCAFDFLFLISETLVRNNVSHILDAHFDSELPVPFLKRIGSTYGAQIVQVQVVCEGEVLEQRFLDRESSKGRHEGHHGMEQYQLIIDLLREGRSKPINIKSRMVVFDTTRLDSPDYQLLFSVIGDCLSRSRRT